MEFWPDLQVLEHIESNIAIAVGCGWIFDTFFYLSGEVRRSYERITGDDYRFVPS